jgi:hypothetical protein
MRHGRESHQIFQGKMRKVDGYCKGWPLRFGVIHFFSLRHRSYDAFFSWSNPNVAWASGLWWRRSDETSIGHCEYPFECLNRSVARLDYSGGGKTVYIYFFASQCSWLKTGC